MYEAHFGLRQRPFRSTPDHVAYYPATGHEYALDALRRGLADDQGLLLVTGAPGTGKTLLCQRLLEKVGCPCVTAYLTNSHVDDRLDLLQAILHDLGLPHTGSEQQCRIALTEHLLDNFQAGKRTILVVDEAHHLDADLLEELRLLGNLEGRDGKAIQIVLAALPEIEERLACPELAALKQRLFTRVSLDGLELHEAIDYLQHQLRVVGGRPDRAFTDEAFELIARASRGVPRLLNHAAHQSLVLACTAEVDQADAEVVLEALAPLGLDVDLEEEDEAGELCFAPAPDRKEEALPVTPTVLAQTDLEDESEEHGPIRLSDCTGVQATLPAQQAGDERDLNIEAPRRPA